MVKAWNVLRIPFLLFFWKFRNQLNGFYDSETGLQQTEHLIKNLLERKCLFFFFLVSTDFVDFSARFKEGLGGVAAVTFCSAIP